LSVTINKSFLEGVLCIHSHKLLKKVVEC